MDAANQSNSDRLEEIVASLVNGDCCQVRYGRENPAGALIDRLRRVGAEVVHLSLASGESVESPETWYRMMSRALAPGGGETSNTRSGPAERFVERLMLAPRAGAGPRIVVVEGIEAVTSLPFIPDEFFAMIRERFNRRAIETAPGPGFCLIGTRWVTEVLRSTATTAFNVGRRFDLRLPPEVQADPARPAPSHRPKWWQRLLKLPARARVSSGSRPPEGDTYAVLALTGRVVLVKSVTSV